MRFLDYELGQLKMVCELFKSVEGRDPAEILPEVLPKPVPFVSQREFVRDVLRQEVSLRANGTEFVLQEEESEISIAFRRQLNSQGNASEIIAAGYNYRPGTELSSEKGQRLSSRANSAKSEKGAVP